MHWSFQSRALAGKKCPVNEAPPPLPENTLVVVSCQEGNYAVWMPPLHIMGPLN